MVSRSSYSRVLSVMLTLLLACVVAGANAQTQVTIDTTPATPILTATVAIKTYMADVPVYLTTNLNACVASEAITTSARTTNTIWGDWTVRLTNASIKATRLCINGGTSYAFVNFHQLTYSPGWVQSATANVLNMDVLIPVGSQIVLHSWPTCTLPLTGPTVYVSASNTITTPSNLTQAFNMCLFYNNTANAASELIRLGTPTFLTGDASIIPTAVVQYQRDVTIQVSFAISSSTGYLRWVYGTDCTNYTRQMYYSDHTATVSVVTEARGVWGVCCDLGSGTWIFINYLNVTAYSALPTTAFAGYATRFSLTQDAPWNTNFVISTDSTCSSSAPAAAPGLAATYNVNPATGIQDPGVAITFASGTTNGTAYYVCVATGTTAPQTYIYAGTVNIVTPYTLTWTGAPLTPAIRGIALPVTATGTSSSTFFLSVPGDCNSNFASFTTTSFAGYLVAPAYGAAVTLSSYQICAITADGTYTYALTTLTQSVAATDFNLTVYGPFAGSGVPTSLVFDPNTPLPVDMYVTSGTTCDTSISPLLVNASIANASRTVTFVLASNVTTISVCMWSTPTVVTLLTTLPTKAFGAFTPSKILVQQQNVQFTVSGVASTGTTIAIINTTTATCPSWPLVADPTVIWNKTVASAWSVSTATPYLVPGTVSIAANGTYLVCVSYDNPTIGAALYPGGWLTVSDVSSVPRYFVGTRSSNVTYTVDSSFGAWAVLSGYFSSTYSCTAPPSSGSGLLFTAVGSHTLPVTAPNPAALSSGPMAYYICVRTGNMTSNNTTEQYSPLSNVTLLPPLDIPFVEAYGGVQGIPFTMQFPSTQWGGYVPSTFHLSTNPTRCVGPFTNGTWDPTTAISSSVTLLSVTTLYAVCVPSPDMSGLLLLAGNVTVKRFDALTKTFVRTFSTPVITSPAAVGSTFDTALALSSNCTGTLYPVGASTPLAISLGSSPPWVGFYVCAYNASDLSWGPAPSLGTVTVVAAFGATLPSPVYGSVQYTIAVNTDASLPDVATVYLLDGLNQACAPLTDTPVAGPFYGVNSATSVNVTFPPRENVTVCAVSVDGTTGASVGSLTALPYATPSEIVKNSVYPSVLTFHDPLLTAGSTVYLTSDTGCTLDPLTSVVAATSTAGVTTATFNIPTSYVGGPTLYLCTLLVGQTGTPTLRDYVLLSDPVSVVVNSTGVDPLGRYLPGVPITISVTDPTTGSNPVLSHSYTCSAPLLDPSTYGVFPTPGTNTTYYICVTTPGGTVVATQQSLTVLNFAVTPAAVVANTAANVTLWPALPRYTLSGAGNVGVYLARDTACVTSVTGPHYPGDPAGMTFPNVEGTYYMCILPGDGTRNYIASVFAYALPTVVQVTPYAVSATPFCISLGAVASGNWTPIAGATPLLGTTTRDFFIAARPDYTTLPLKSPTCTTAVAATFRITALSTFCYDTAGVTAGVAYDLCGPTPIGPAPYLAGVTLYQLQTFPAGFVANVAQLTPTQATPPVPLTQFAFSNTSDCSRINVAPSFTSNAAGLMQVDMRQGSAFTAPYDTPFVAGTYYLCMYFNTAFTATAGRAAASLAVTANTWYPVATAAIGYPEHYAISPTRIIVQTPTQVQLLLDLQYGYLLGFSTSTTCASGITNSSALFVAPVYDAFGTLVNTAATLYYNGTTTTTFTLCALVPLNGTTVPVAQVTFTSSNSLAFPTTQSACSNFVITVTSATDALAVASDTVVAVYADACCAQSTLTPSRAVAVATRTGTQTFTASITQLRANLMLPQTIFSVCAVSTSADTCLQAGYMNVTQSLCVATPAPGPMTPVPGANALVSGSLLYNGPSAAPDADYAWLIVAAVLFVLLLLVSCAFCARFMLQRRANTVPPDERDRLVEVKQRSLNFNGTATGFEEDDRPADSFALIFAENRTHASVAASTSSIRRAHRQRQLYCEDGSVNVRFLTRGLPFDPTLDICLEASDESVALEAEEQREREDIALCEQFLFQKLWRDLVAETAALTGGAAIDMNGGGRQHRAFSPAEGSEAWEEEFELLQDDEEDARADLERAEREALYDLGALEQELFRRIAAGEHEAFGGAWRTAGDSTASARSGPRSGRAGVRTVEDVDGPFSHASPQSARRAAPTRVEDSASPAERSQRSRSSWGDVENAPVPPLLEDAPSIARGGSRTAGGLNALQFLGRGDLPAAPAPSPPPLAIRGDPLLHFTVPAAPGAVARAPSASALAPHQLGASNFRTESVSAVPTPMHGAASATPHYAPHSRSALPPPPAPAPNAFAQQLGSPNMYFGGFSGSRLGPDPFEGVGGPAQGKFGAQLPSPPTASPSTRVYVGGDDFSGPNALFASPASRREGGTLGNPLYDFAVPSAAPPPRPTANFGSGFHRDANSSGTNIAAAASNVAFASRAAQPAPQAAGPPRVPVGNWTPASPPPHVVQGDDEYGGVEMRPLPPMPPGGNDTTVMVSSPGRTPPPPARGVAVGAPGGVAGRMLYSPSDAGSPGHAFASPSAFGDANRSTFEWRP